MYTKEFGQQSLIKTNIEYIYRQKSKKQKNEKKMTYNVKNKNMEK